VSPAETPARSVLVRRSGRAGLKLDWSWATILTDGDEGKIGLCHLDALVAAMTEHPNLNIQCDRRLPDPLYVSIKTDRIPRVFVVGSIVQLMLACCAQRWICSPTVSRIGGRRSSGVEQLIHRPTYRRYAASRSAAIVAQAHGQTASIAPQALIRESTSSIRPGSAECSSALRFGATYCASSANTRPRSSTGFLLFIAIRAMPVIGSQRSPANHRDPCHASDRIAAPPISQRLQGACWALQAGGLLEAGNGRAAAGRSST
jgi:hypothetical protein